MMVNFWTIVEFKAFWKSTEQSTVPVPLYFLEKVPVPTVLFYASTGTDGTFKVPSAQHWQQGGRLDSV